MNNPATASQNTNPFVKALRQANFTLAGSDVRVQNFSLPFLEKQNGTMEIREPLPFEFLFPWQNRVEWDAQKISPDAKLTLLHFSLHECEPCHTEVSQLQGMLARGELPPNVQLWQVVGGTDASAIVADEMIPIVPNGAKTHLDLEDGLSERLGAIGAPATWILDEAGLVVGYRNGDMDFETPGMEVLLARLREWPQLQKQNPKYTSLALAVTDPNFLVPDTPTTVLLKKLPISGLALTILIGATLIAGFRIWRKIRAKYEQ